ncbi:hypothetical protein MTR67_008099 [Solanum verrucosum]|uniref:Uncharacterized protein n=1 Tax=Solanum verrucosum TaxID=315347 RepID=A0AAF0Q0T9_SOLVR|nr:hypothetical protein MTR67_008099 [Solanum verrucosum]
MISSQMQGPGPLQSMLVQVCVQYNWKAVALEVGEVTSVPHQLEWTRLFCPMVINSLRLI